MEKESGGTERIGHVVFRRAGTTKGTLSVARLNEGKSYPVSESQRVHVRRGCAVEAGCSRTIARRTPRTYSDILRGLLHPLELLLIHDCGACACSSASFLDTARGAIMKLWAMSNGDGMGRLIDLD